MGQTVMAAPSLPGCLTLLLVFLTRMSGSSPHRSTPIPTVRTVVQQENTTVGAVPLSVVQQENTTVGAVPLAAESTTITETPPQSTSTSTSSPETKSTENEFGINADTRQDGSTTAAETTTANEMTTVESPISTTEQLPPGRIPWAPYTALKEEDKEYLTDDMDPWEHRVWLPEVETAMGRWVSKDMAQAQLLNIQPGFLLPQVEVGDHPEIEKPDIEIKPEFLLHQVEVEGLPDV